MEKTTPANEPAGRSRKERTVEFVKRNSTAIVSGSSAVVITTLGIALGCSMARCRALERKNAALLSLCADAMRRNQLLERLIAEKDAWMLAMTSEALRLGSSFAGKCLAEWRYYSASLKKMP